VRLLRALSDPGLQVVAAVLALGAGLVLLVSFALRWTPLASLSIGREEPPWVLLLSILALVFAGLSAVPAALAYREVKSGN